MSTRRHAAMPRTEAQLVDSLGMLLARQWPVRAVGTEVRSHGRCRTDLCALISQGARGPDQLLIGIEAKLTDWARAVGQAALNRYAVDLAYVAMPAGRTPEALWLEAARHGVGVFAVGRRSLEIVLAAGLSKPDSTLRARIASQLRPVRPRGKTAFSDLVLHPVALRSEPVVVAGAA